MIMRILLPDRGRRSASWATRRWAAANDRVGYLPEERGLYKQMRVREVLRFYAELKGLRGPSATGHRRVARAAWAWPTLADKKVEALSKGMSQKVQFIATVVARAGAGAARRAVQRARPGQRRGAAGGRAGAAGGGGTTVIFSTHDMGVAEKMCDFIFMIYKGRKVLDGTLDDDPGRLRARHVRVRLDGHAARRPARGGPR